MTLKKKLLSLVILPVLVSTTIAVIISSIEIKNQGIEGLEDKSSAILSLNIDEYVIHHQDGSNIVDDTNNENVKKGGDDLAQHYKFRISSKDPENSKHLSTLRDNKFIDQFEKEKAAQINYIDKETDSLLVMRPVFMDKSKGCMDCHAVSKSGLKSDENALRGIFVVTSAMKHTNDQVKSAIFQISLLGFIIIIGAILLGSVVVLKILSALEQINSVSKKVSEGDLQQKVVIHTKDELAELGSYINIMISSLNKVLVSVRKAATGLTLSTKEIASTSEEIAQGALNQANQFEDLRNSFQFASDNAIKVNDFISKSVSNAKIAGVGMNKTVESMSNIEKSSVKINEAVKIISNISFQTNLLALNAAVEAAHAGNNGRGFSVIAAEVKKLSDITTNSSNEINQVTTNNLSQVENGVKVAQDAGSKIAEIMQSITDIAIMLKEIAKANQEQSVILENNREITISNTGASERLNTSAISLDDQANQLMDIVQYFKLNLE